MQEDMSKSKAPRALPATYVEGFHDREQVMKMKYNRLGSTGYMISHLSLGGGAFSNFYGNCDDDEAIATIREAIKSGINFIDTAPWYGHGRSEIILGKALKEIPRQAYYIGTKVGRYEKKFENMFDFSARKTELSVHESLKKLGIDYVDIIQVHDIEFAPSLDTVLTETLPALQKLKDEGKAKFIGVTGYPLFTLHDLIDQSKVKLHTVQTYARNTLIDMALNDYSDLLLDQGVAIISGASLGMGLLTNNGPPDWHPASNEIKEACKNAAEYCKKEDVELARLALRYALQNFRVSTHLVGMNTREMLEANLSVFRNGLTEHEKEVLRSICDQYFCHITKFHWEGVEVRKYKDYMKKFQ